MKARRARCCSSFSRPWPPAAPVCSYGRAQPPRPHLRYKSCWLLASPARGSRGPEAPETPALPTPAVRLSANEPACVCLCLRVCVLRVRVEPPSPSPPPSCVAGWLQHGRLVAVGHTEKSLRVPGWKLKGPHPPSVQTYWFVDTKQPPPLPPPRHPGAVMMGTHNEQTSAHLGPGPAADEQEHMSTLPLPRPSQNIRPDQQFSGLGLLDTNTNPWHQMSSSSNSNGIHHQPYSHHHSNSGLEFASNLSADLQNLPPLHQPTPREPLPPLERFLHENETKAFLGAGSALHHDHASRVAASEPAWSQTGRSEFGGVPQYQDSLETTSVYSEGYPDPFYDSQPTTTASTSWAGSVDNLHKKSIDDCRLSPTSPASFRQEAAWRSSMSSSYASEPGYSPTDDRMPFRTGVLVASSSSGGPGAGPGGGSVGVGVGGGRLDVEQPLDVSEDEDADGEEEVAEDAGGRGSAPHIYVTQIASVNMQQDFHYHPSHPHHPSQSHAPTEAIARRHSSPRNTSKNVHHHRPPVHARSRSGPMPPPPRLDTTGGLQRSASSSSRSNCGRRRSIKAHSHGHQPYGTPPDHRSHSKKSQCSRPFDCVFEWAGCQQKFASKNEWKRHVSSQHLLLYYWRCDLDTCRDRHSVFNRKDLFGQHLKRMHKPTSQEDNARFLNRDIPVIQDRCKRMIRPPPDRSACGFCGEVFDGPGSWDQRMEHVGRHYENAGPDGRGVESAHWNQDHDLVAYAVRERIVFLNQDGTYTLAASGKEAVVGGALEAEQPVGVHVQQLG